MAKEEGAVRPETAPPAQLTASELTAGPGQPSSTKLSRDEAEKLTLRIGLKLNALADMHDAVMPLIREAIDRRAHEALGYPSIGAYAADRFGDSLTRLGVDMRRDVVKELTSAGMSTRDIAPIVGVSKDTVNRDQAAVSHETPDMVTGHDGKTYRRPASNSDTLMTQDEARATIGRIHQALDAVDQACLERLQDGVPPTTVADELLRMYAGFPIHKPEFGTPVWEHLISPRVRAIFNYALVGGAA